MFLEQVSNGLLWLSGNYQIFFSYYCFMYVEGFILQHTLQTGFFFFLQANFTQMMKTYLFLKNEIISNDINPMGLANFKIHIFKTQRCVSQIMV